MNSIMIVLLLYVSTLFPGIVNMDKVDSVEQGLATLNAAFPDWAENYQMGEFDCSEMSAFVAQYFRCAGFKDVKVMVARSRYKGQPGHAWVVVDGKVIEAVILTIADGAAFKQCFKKSTECDTIKHRKSSDWDWWRSDYFQDRGMRAYFPNAI